MTLPELRAAANTLPLPGEPCGSLPMAQSNPLFAAIQKQRYITGRWQCMQELGNRDLFTAYIKTVDTIVETLLAINGEDEHWQAWLDSQPIEEVQNELGR